MRVIAGGDGFDGYRDNEFTDKYVKLHFVDPALGLQPPYDLEVLRESLPPEQRPVTRTYTVRRGDEGIAAPWARSAEPGDRFALSGAGGGYRPDPTCDHHVFLGDESALPAINAALDALPPTASGVVFAETSDAEGAFDAAIPERVEVVMLHRATPGSRPDLLAQALLDHPWPVGRVDVFAHGERESMKAVRAALATRRSESDLVSLSGYWAQGRTEDRFQAEKREPIGQLG